MNQRKRRDGVLRHQSEWLLFTKLTRAQRGDGGGVARVTSKMIPAEPLHGEDTALAKQLDRAVDRGPVSVNHTVITTQRVMRAASRARHGLRVEAAVCCVMILIGAS